MTEAQPESEAQFPSTLTPRQEAFCQNYVTEPTSTHAAVLAGYSEKTAPQQASRLLRNVNVLARVAELRREQGIVYRVEADSLLDKLEAVYHTAMAEQHYGAAVKAVAAQARIAGYWQLQRAPELPSMAALSMMGAAAANACAYRRETGSEIRVGTSVPGRPISR